MNVNMSKYIFKIFVLLGGTVWRENVCVVFDDIVCVIVVPPTTNFAVGSLCVFFSLCFKIYASILTLLSSPPTDMQHAS